MPNPPAPSPGVGDPAYEYGALTPLINAFLGYRPTAEELEGFPFEIYRFIIRSIRDRDRNEGIGGTRLLERFLLGPQEVWFDLYLAGSKLNTLFDPEEIESDYLGSLARYVGFGNDLADIVGTATEEQLRKIVANAIEFWRKRWLDSGITAAIRMVTGNRFKVRDFFDYRFIVGETRIEEDLKNTDPNMISVKTRNFFRQGTDGETRYGSDPYTFYSASQIPKAEDIDGYIVIFDDTGSPTLNRFYEVVAVDPFAHTWTVDVGDWFPRADTGQSWLIAFPYDEFLTEIRIVDEKTGQGEVDRTLLEKLLSLQRPNSERFNVVYVDFMDLFQTPNDLGQWDETTGTDIGLDIVEVANGFLKMSSTYTYGGGLICNRPTADFSTFQWKIKAALGSATGAFTFNFYWYDSDNFLMALVDYTGFGTGTVKFFTNISGVFTPVATVSFPDLNPETYWTYTIDTYSYESGDVRVRIFVDGNLFIDETVTPDYTSGNIILGCGTNSEVWIEETELWQYPLDISRVGPNP